jgi:hypothetical protein
MDLWRRGEGQVRSEEKGRGRSGKYLHIMII